MTVITGIYGCEGGVESHLQVWNSIKKLLSRDNYNNVIEFTNTKCCFAKIDVGAFYQSGIYNDSEGNFSMIAGDPLLDPVTKKHDRHRCLMELHKYLLKVHAQKLQYTRGMFCGAFFL